MNALIRLFDRLLSRYSPKPNCPDPAPELSLPAARRDRARFELEVDRVIARARKVIGDV